MKSRGSSEVSGRQIGPLSQKVAAMIALEGAEHLVLNAPTVLPVLQRESESLDFRFASEPAVGSLLRVLAASKAAGNLLELGTGTGIGTAWLLDGMGPSARLLSVENDARVMAVARRNLGRDTRVTFQMEDAAAVLGRLPEATWDLVYADTWVGKYMHLEETLRLLRTGGLYVVDDMLPQPDWSLEHRAKTNALRVDLERRTDLALSTMDWSTGIIVAAKRG